MRIGDLVPDFSLPDETGRERSLSEFLEAGPVVLFFYPMAMTTGCTAEACSFRDSGAAFGQLGAQRVGISADAVTKQRAFSELHGFDFPLLSDPDRKAAELFGVRRSISFLPNKRWTFVIDTDRRVLDIIKSEVRMSSHSERALETLSARSTKSSAS